jgi:hypothetical protein
MTHKTLARIAATLAISALSIAAFAACDDDEDPETAEGDASAAFCSDLTELGTALAAMGDLTVDSTIEDVEAAQDDVTSAYDDVIESAGDVADARVDGLEAAYDDLASAVDDVSGEDTVGEAITDVAAASEAVEDERASLNDAVACG